MSLAILFWFYKDPEICINRLELIKKYNPNTKIYGLYGGPKAEKELYKDKLKPFLDDFYTSKTEDTSWKWIHGDLVLLEWYENRGKSLEWDSIAIVQWDMLIFTNLNNYFSDVKKGEVLLAGFQPLDKYTENNWSWTKSDYKGSHNKERDNYLQFLDYVEKEYSYTDIPYCCQFIFEIFPKEFFSEYSNVKNKELGMLEYKIPIYAKIFGLNIIEKDLGVHWWQKDQETLPLNADTREIKDKLIKEELEKENGWRIFHPYFKQWKLK